MGERAMRCWAYYDGLLGMYFCDSFLAFEGYL